jgi:uncharacterized membrane protein YidH (DUF202 family)
MNARELDHIRFVSSHFNDLQGLRYWVPLGIVTLSLGGTTYFESVPFRVLRAVLLLGAILLAFAARRYYRSRFGEVEAQSLSPVLEPALSIYCPAGSSPRLDGGFQDVKPALRLFSLVMGLSLAALFTVWAMGPSVIIEEDESLLQAPWQAPAAVFMAAADGSGLWGLNSKTHLGHLLYGLFGSFFLAVWLWRGRRASQSYYLVFGLLLLGLSTLGAALGWILWQRTGLWMRVVDSLTPFLGHLWVALLLCGVLTIVAGLLDHQQLSRMLKG